MQEGVSKASSRMGLKRTNKEMVNVHGGRIVRSTGRKDRHSKVSTAKGPRDRRVRLSANTAIEFYDVQDRLGYDRPSKAIDWLMVAAKAAIDALEDQLPHVSNLSDRFTIKAAHQPEQDLEEYSQSHHQKHPDIGFLNSEYEIHNPILNFNFFSVASNAATPPSDFQNYSHDQLNSRTRCQSQDLCLSLQSFQDDSIILNPIHPEDHQQGIFSASTPLHLTDSPEMDQFQRMGNWTSNLNSVNGKEERLVIDRHLQQVLGQNQWFSQREPLQSSTCSPSIRASMNTQLSNVNYSRMPLLNPSFLTHIGFTNDAFSGFSVWPRIQGQEEEQNPVSNKSTSAATIFHYQD